MSNYDGLMQKFFLEFIDSAGERKQLEVEDLSGKGLDHIYLPLNFNSFSADDITFRFHAREGFAEYKEFEFFKNLVLGTGATPAFERIRREDPVLRGLSDGYLLQADDDSIKFPDITCIDITEQEMFGYPAINSAILRSEAGGIWANHGLRKFKISVKNLPEEISNNFKMKVNLFWNQIDTRKIDPIFENEVREISADDSNENDDDNIQTFSILIDTTRLGKAIAENKIESKHPLFFGRFEVHYIFNGNRKIAYTFPIELCVHDTRIDNKGRNHLLDKNIVSIDFGTSSTCAAVQAKGKNHLFTLSGIEKTDETSDNNPYENPTNLMIYRWTNIYDQWRRENENCPFILTKSKTRDDRTAEYDSGYTVEAELNLNDAEDDKIMNSKMRAILTQLKQIPQNLKDGSEIRFIPFKGRDNSPITVVDAVEEETEVKFNPIAFYGYILSRAINNPANGNFYKTYQITYPVKFDKDTQEKIRKSLEYGIKRALPKPLAEAVNKNGEPVVSVQMVYPESVACVGSIVGRQLQVSESSPEAKLFAVYDLGGGTVDFSYGMFRNALDDDEAEEAEQFIEVFGIEGENDAGGEFLIHELAYKIYLDNREAMEEKRIKFVKPPKALNPAGFVGLISRRGDYIADANVNIIKENLARPLFKHYEEIGNSLTDIFPDHAVDQTHFALPFLIDERGNTVDDYTTGSQKNNGFVVTVEGIDEFIESKISETIFAFKSRMKAMFEKNIDSIRTAGIENFNIDDVYIFLAGNASKQHYVREKLDESFEENNIRGHIMRIGEDVNDENQSKEYAINEKTAVAFGQIDLANYGYVSHIGGSDDNEQPFPYNVGYIDSGTRKFVTVIEKSSAREWKKANRIDMAMQTTNLRYTADLIPRENALIPLSEDVSDFVDTSNKRKSTLFIRIVDANHIEFRIGGMKDMPSNDEPIDEDMILKLQ